LAVSALRQSAHSQWRVYDLAIVCMTLPQLKGGDAEYPVQPQRRDRASIHARSLEHRHETEVLRQRDRVAVEAGNVEETSPAPTGPPRCDAASPRHLPAR
jgi:hypothetical protein